MATRAAPRVTARMTDVASLALDCMGCLRVVCNAVDFTPRSLTRSYMAPVEFGFKFIDWRSVVLALNKSESHRSGARSFRFLWDFSRNGLEFDWARERSFNSAQVLNLRHGCPFLVPAGNRCPPSSERLKQSPDLAILVLPRRSPLGEAMRPVSRKACRPRIASSCRRCRQISQPAVALASTLVRVEVAFRQDLTGDRRCRSDLLA